MSLDILLSEMNEDEIEILSAELVARLSGEHSVSRSKPETTDLDPTPLHNKAPEAGSEPTEFTNQLTDEPSTYAYSESREPSPALEQILSAMKSWDTEFSPDPNFAPNEPVYNTDFPDRAERQDGLFDEPQGRQNTFDTSHPAEVTLSKVPDNASFTVTEDADNAEKSEAAFSSREDTVPAFRSGMERVSDFFMRDSRRYDSGFERF